MLDVGALVPLSTVDWPGKSAAVLYLHGCPWECADCPRPMLRPRPAEAAVSWTAVLEFLDGRKGQLEAVVFSGGEPTLQAALAKSIAQVRRRGFRVALHTAGIYPRRLAQVLPSCDWVAFEVKGPFEAYPALTGRVTGATAAAESLDLLVQSGVPHEVRTTWNARLHSSEGLLAMARGLAARGVREFVLQVPASRAAPRVPGAKNEAPLPHAALAGELGRLFERFTWRELQAR